MTFDARRSIDEGFVHLAVRLDPIIAARLAHTLGGLLWTAILEQLDVAKGRAPGRYATSDPQAQLRMLTERLGGIGFPFDDPARTTTTWGNELRILRNQLAHHDDLDTLDALRMHDFSCRLLTRLGDDGGAKVSADARDEALGVFSRERGLAAAAAVQTLPPAAVSAGPASPLLHGVDAPESQPAEATERGSEHVVAPDASVLTRTAGPETPVVGAQRSKFEPWSVVIVGEVTVLDDLPKHAAKQRVRAVAAEIVEFEGPIHLDRLTSLVAASFGVHRLAAKRKQQLIRHVRATGLRVSQEGFVWPEGLDSKTWTEFRPNDSTIDRPFAEISPVEISNAMAFIAASRPALGDEVLDRETLRTFGKSRKTQSVVKHLALTRKIAAGRDW
jgi:hypothetical protein